MTGSRDMMMMVIIIHWFSIPALHGWRRSGCYSEICLFFVGRIGSEASKAPSTLPKDQGFVGCM